MGLSGEVLRARRKKLTVDSAMAGTVLTAVIGAVGAVVAAWVQGRAQRQPQPKEKDLEAGRTPRRRKARHSYRKLPPA
jgi:hypothetical protein